MSATSSLHASQPLPARHHRRATKAQGVVAGAPWRRHWRWLFAPLRLNWWIGSLFALGSVCFALASALQLWPQELSVLAASRINWIYFVGSVPFSIAGGLALMQSAHAPAPLDRGGPGQMPFPGFKPRDLGWWSAALQFLGTLLFNINTFSGALSGLQPEALLLLVWVPNFVGSVLFLVSGLLAYLEGVHHWLRLELRSLSWWVVVINFAGCVGFMISALASYAPTGQSPWAPTLALATTVQGAICFLVGALLSLAEAAHEAEPRR